MSDIILTEKQLAKVVELIKSSKPIINEFEHAPTYSLRDLERAFEAGQETVWDDVEQTTQSPKYETFEDWFKELTYAKRQMRESEEGSYMSKQHLFTIATLAYKMWEQMGDGVELEDWMESKIAQAEQSIVTVVKAHMYDEVEDGTKGMDKLDPNDLIIGN